MRVLIDLPEDDVEWLDRKASEAGKSRAALVREVIAGFRAETGKRGIERFLGAWKDRQDIRDGLQFQRNVRDDWESQ